MIEQAISERLRGEALAAERPDPRNPAAVALNKLRESNAAKLARTRPPSRPDAKMAMFDDTEVFCNLHRRSRLSQIHPSKMWKK